MTSCLAVGRSGAIGEMFAAEVAVEGCDSVFGLIQTDPFLVTCGAANGFGA